MNAHELVDRLNGVIDQGKFIRNLLSSNENYNPEEIKKYIIELKEMINGIKENNYGT